MPLRIPVAQSLICAQGTFAACPHVCCLLWGTPAHCPPAHPRGQQKPQGEAAWEERREPPEGHRASELSKSLSGADRPSVSLERVFGEEGEVVGRPASQEKPPGERHLESRRAVAGRWPAGRPRCCTRQAPPRRPGRAIALPMQKTETPRAPSGGSRVRPRGTGGHACDGHPGPVPSCPQPFARPTAASFSRLLPSPTNFPWCHHPRTVPQRHDILTAPCLVLASLLATPSERPGPSQEDPQEACPAAPPTLPRGAVLPCADVVTGAGSVTRRLAASQVE